jgi:hypothetical protein
MSEETPRRTGSFGGIFVAVVVAGSAVGVIGWYLLTNRSGPAIDSTGFDMSTAPQAPKPHFLASSSAPDQPVSSLSMMKADAGVRIADGNAPASKTAPAAAKSADKKEESHASFTEAARKHEADVRAFSMKMEKKFPVLRQYARDWMSHPDLRDLTNGYARNHDPVAFIMGLTKAPSLGTMVKQYAGNPAITGYVTEAMKEAPSDLMGSAMDVLSNDTVAKNLMANVAAGIGLPASVTSVIAGSGDPSKLDSKQVMSDMMNNNPEMQKAMQQQGDQPTPVALPNQR